MRPEVLEQKTAVFSFGSLAVEEPRSYDVDEPTRELPLIAGRFAGREWDVEALRQEEDRKKEARRTRQNRAWFVPALSAAAAVVLLVGSLTGQAALLDVSEKAAASRSEIASLSLERDTLRLEYARSALTQDRSAPALESVRTREDKATVLSVRRGHELDRFWDSVVDVLGESFH